MSKEDKSLDEQIKDILTDLAKEEYDEGYLDGDKKLSHDGPVFEGRVNPAIDQLKSLIAQAQTESRLDGRSSNEQAAYTLSMTDDEHIE